MCGQAEEAGVEDDRRIQVRSLAGGFGIHESGRKMGVARDKDTQNLNELGDLFES